MKTYNLSSENAFATNSSGGKLLKWKNGNIFIKTSTIDTSSIQTKFMYESYGEVICSHIAKLLNIDCVEYKLCNVIIDNRISTIACESQDFTLINNEKYTYKSIARLILDNCIPRYEMYKPMLYENIIREFGNNQDYKRYIDNNIMIDILTLNDDRHFGNFGILVGKGKYKVPPVFDNGNSLFCHKYVEEIQYSDDLMTYLRCKPFSPNFNEEAKLIDIAKNYNLNKVYESTRNLIKYMVNKQGLPEQRGKFTVDLIKSRVNYLKGH